MKTIKLINIPIEVIYPNNSQPRKYFDNQALLELSQSIQEYGILQPIIVSKEANRYIIIAGERRYRAAKLLKLTTLPCLVHQSSQIKVISIIENLQREDLSPMEEATAISEYMKESVISQSDMATILSKSRSYIANSLRLLKLDEFTASHLRNKKLSEGHAKTLLGVKEQKKRVELVNRIIKEGLSVRATEKYVRQANCKLSKKLEKNSNENLEIDLKDTNEKLENIYIEEAMDRLIDILGTKVHISGSQQKGSLVIDYYDKDQLFDLVEKLYSLE